MTQDGIVLGEGGGRAVRRAAMIFLAPGLVLIAVTFLLPALASLVLSLTDFDIYATRSHKDNALLQPAWAANPMQLILPQGTAAKEPVRKATSQAKMQSQPARVAMAVQVRH